MPTSAVMSLSVQRGVSMPLQIIVLLTEVGNASETSINVLYSNVQPDQIFSQKNK